MNLYFNPQKLLTEAGAGWVWDVTFTIILTGLAISFVAEIFKIQKKGDPDFAGLVWKTCVILILYKFLPSAVEGIAQTLNGSLQFAELDAGFFKAFSTVYANLNLSAGSSELPEGCPSVTNITLMSAGIDYIASYFTQYIQKLILFVIVAGIWVCKEIVFSWMWPVLMSVNMIGMCSALIIPSFPGQGFASLGGFFKSLASISLWPVVYSAIIFICQKPFVKVLEITNEMLKCPSAVMADSSYITAISGTAFMLFMIILTPFFSRRIVCHEGVKSAVAAGLTGFASVITFSGREISRTSDSTGIMSGISAQLIKSGNKLAEYSANNKKISEYNNISLSGIKQEWDAEPAVADWKNTSRELVKNEKSTDR